VQAEAMMADYTFDGTRLRKKSSGQALAEIDRDTIRFYNAAVYGRIEKNNVRDSRNKKVAELDGKVLKDDRGAPLIGIKELQEIIEGEPGIAMAAMWYFFVRGRTDHAGML
jgi:hypothetical protein